MIDDCTAAGEYAEDLRELAPDWPAAKVRVAEYEFECNGDTALAAEIYKSLDFEDIGWFVYAWWAALQERDVEWALELIEWDDPFPWPFDEVWDELGTAQLSRYVLQDEEAVALALDRAEILLAEMGANPEEESHHTFAHQTAFLYSLRGDAIKSTDWLELSERRFEAETKGDTAERSKNRMGHAIILTQAGLYDEAVEQLRIMLEEPGGYRFPVVDGIPIFEALENHPGYIALRDQFSSSESNPRR
jgi:hypothetical protein